MNDTLDWLIVIKSLSRKFYANAAKTYANDKSLNRFLSTLAHDELVHTDVIMQICEISKSSGEKFDIAGISAFDKKGYVKEFEDAIHRLSSSPFGKDELLETIVTLERTEWSDILTEALKKSKGKIRSLSQAAMNLQKHKNYVIRYVEKNHSDRSVFKRLPASPIFWNEKILVIDNYVHIRSLLKNIFRKKGIVESATDTKTAMALLKDRYYAVIISETLGKDIDGVSFYRQAIEEFPGLSNRFLFFTSLADHKQINFFKQNSIPYLLKPSGLRQLKAAVSEILAKRV